MADRPARRRSVAGARPGPRAATGRAGRADPRRRLRIRPVAQPVDPGHPDRAGPGPAPLTTRPERARKGYAPCQRGASKLLAMTITRVERVVYGVADLDECTRSFEDC